MSNAGLVGKTTTCSTVLGLALVLGAAALPGALSAQDLRLPDFGDPSARYLDSDRERQLGAEVLARLRRRGVIIDDVILDDYLSSLGQRLAVYADQSNHGYHYYWIDAASINAFAAPGGFIGVHAGLMLATASEAELAGVLAHETAHVAQRHIARAYAQAQQFSLPVLAAMLAGAALSAAGNGQAGRAALAGAAAFGAQRQVNFTRANEREADRIGYQLVTKAGFDPNGIADFFARLQRAQPKAIAQLPEFILTHPLPADRIADAQLRLDRSPAAPRRGRGSADAYLHAKARLRTLVTSNSNDLVRYFEQRLADDSSAAARAERYGYALALHRAGRYTEALRQARALRKAADELIYRILEAEAALAGGDPAAAGRLFEDSLTLYPDDFRLALHYGRALVNTGQAGRALSLLEPFLKRRPNSLVLYDVYAQAAQRVGDRSATHAALAEYYYLSGDLDMAVQQAELGLQDDSSPYRQAQLQARLRQLEQQREQRKK